MIDALMARIEAGHYPDEEDRQAQVDRLASQYGCTVEVATDDVLLLDLDWRKRLRCSSLASSTRGPVDSRSAATSSCQSRSAQTKGSQHARVQLEGPPPLCERILLQVLLGSDPTRELLCYARAREGVEPNIVLFRPIDD
jgi:hypothetical protein